MTSQTTPSGLRNAYMARGPNEVSHDQQPSSPAGADSDDQRPAQDIEQSDLNPWRKLRDNWPNLGNTITSWWSTRDFIIGLASLVLTIVGLWVAVNANKFAVWTSIKDYIEYCKDQVCTIKPCEKRKLKKYNRTLRQQLTVAEQAMHPFLRRPSSGKKSAGQLRRERALGGAILDRVIRRVRINCILCLRFWYNLRLPFALLSSSIASAEGLCKRTE